MSLVDWISRSASCIELPVLERVKVTLVDRQNEFDQLLRAFVSSASGKNCSHSMLAHVHTQRGLGHL